MGITFTLTVGQTSSGTWQTATGYTNLNLRLSPYAVATYTQDSHLGDGVYKFVNVASGEYKLFNGSSEMTKYGIIKIGEDGAVLITGNQTIAGIKTFSSQPVLSAGLKTDTISEKTAAAGVTIDGILLKDDLQTSNIPGLSFNNSFSGNNTHQGINDFLDEVTFGGKTIFTDYLPQCNEVPSDDSDLTNKLYVDSLAISPYQESINRIRLMPGGIQESNKVYTSWAAAMSYCKTNGASDTFRMCIDIEGAGSSGASITVSNAGGGFKDFENYVSVKGKNQNIKLIVGDDTWTVTAGKVIIENVTIYNHDTGADPNFVNFIFKDCYFDFQTNTATFNGCTFRGNCYVKSTSAVTWTSCKGGIVMTNDGGLPATIIGYGGLSTSDF